MRTLSADDGQAIRIEERAHVDELRRQGRHWRLLWLLVGPGILTMIGENDGPSMISYAATGRAYGFGLFLPFIIVTFAAAAVCQEACMRLGSVTHRGFGELVAQRYGPLWGFLAAGDLAFTNFVTLVAEFVAVRVGLAYFGVPAPLAVGLVALVLVLSVAGQRYRRWERRALALAVFNLLFVASAFAAHPTLGAVAGSFVSTSPLGAPSGELAMLIASTIGATVTPWMIFFQQSAVADKGLGKADVGHGRLDLALGTSIAALCGCGAYVAAAVGHAEPGSVVGLVADPARALFALGLIQAGTLAIITISASSAYALGECVGVAHTFNAAHWRARAFYAMNVVMPLVAGALVLLPGVPLLTVALDANVLATVVLPVTFVFLILLVNDRYLMGNAMNGRLANTLLIAVVLLVSVAGIGAATQGLLQALR